MEEYVTRFIFYVNVADLPPKLAEDHVKKVKSQAMDKNFFPADSVLFVPVRNRDTHVEAFSFPKSQLF